MYWCAALHTALPRHSRSCGVVVITSALHAEGPQFDPGRDQATLLIFKTRNVHIASLLSACLRQQKTWDIAVYSYTVSTADIEMLSDTSKYEFLSQPGSVV